MRLRYLYLFSPLCASASFESFSKKQDPRTGHIVDVRHSSQICALSKIECLLFVHYNLDIFRDHESRTLSNTSRLSVYIWRDNTERFHKIIRCIRDELVYLTMECLLREIVNLIDVSYIVPDSWVLLS